ncbi:acyl-CoA thioesterase [Paenibacillus sp. MBLB4367]|uniref:acyl-CoA thioesterase n=1 Tax=Paenibacillus sp. MBLB4367 TaxID=3384767 RepID=UPI00390824CE
MNERRSKEAMSEAKWYKHTIRVRYQETDQMGVVYHTNYMNWFEWGRTELIRAMGMTYSEMETRGLLLPVTHAELVFKQPARYDESIGIFTRIVEYSGLKLHFESEIRRLSFGEGGPDSGAAEDSCEGPFDVPQGELLVSGGTRHVWVNRNWKPVRIDREAPDLFRLLQDRA